MADNEHKVVYRAVAKFGELYREIAEANAAVKTLRDEHNKNAKAAQDEAKAVTRANQEIVASAKSANDAIERDTLKRERNISEARDRAHSQALKEYKRFLDERAKLDEQARKKSVEAALKLQGTHPDQLAAARKQAAAEEISRTQEQAKVAAEAARQQAKRDADHLRAIKEYNRYLEDQRRLVALAAEADRKRLEEQRRGLLQAAEARRVAERAQEIFEEGERKHQAKVTDERAARPAATRSGRDLTPDELEREVKDAILRLQRERGAWVSILRLRNELGDKLSRDQVDQALRRIEQQDGFNIVPENVRGSLRPEDHAAAIQLGGQDKHLVTAFGDDFAQQKAEAERRNRARQEQPQPPETPVVDDGLRQQVARRRAEELARREVRDEGLAAERELREQEKAVEAAAKLQEKRDKEHAKTVRELETERQRGDAEATKVQEKRDADHARALREYGRVLKAQQDDALRTQGVHPDQILAAHREALQIEKETTREAQRAAAVQAKRDADHFKAAREYERVLKAQENDALRAQGIHPDQIKAAQTEAVQINNARTREAAKAAKEIQRLRDKDHAEALVQIRRESDERARVLKARRSGKARSLANTGTAARNLFRRSSNRSDFGDERGTSTSGAFLSLADVVPRLGEGMTRFQTIVVAVTIALIAAIPIAAALTAAFGALLSAVTAGAAALGVFALAAVGHIAALKKALDDAKKSGAAVAPQFQLVAGAFAALQVAYQTFLNLTQQEVFGVLIDALNLLQGLLPRLAPIVNATATALRNVLNQVADAAKSGTFDAFLKFAGTEGPDALILFTKILLTFGQGLAELMLAFAPFITFFVAGLQRMASQFEAWAAGLSKSDRFKAFMDYAMRTGPRVLQIFYDLVSAAINLAVGLTPVGEVLLTLVQIAARFLAALPPAAIAGITFAILGLWGGFRLLIGLGKVVEALKATFLAVKAFLALDAVRSLLVRFAAAFPALAAAMGIAETGAVSLRFALVALTATTVIGAVITALVYLLGKLSLAHKDAGEAAQRQADNVKNLTDSLRESNGVASETVAQAANTALNEQQEARYKVSAPINPFDTGNRTTRASIQQVATREGVDQQDLTKGLVGDTAAASRVQAQLDKAAQEADIKAASVPGKDADKLKETAAQAHQAADAYRDLAGAAGTAASQNDSLAGTTNDLTSSLHDSALATGTFLDKLKALGTQTEAQQGLTGAFDALTAYKKAVRDLADAQQAQKDTAVDVARANEDAIKKVAEAQKSASRADQAATRAQEDLTQARIDATEKIKDQQRVLRDIPLDEKEADLAVKRARRARGTATGLDRQQANLDYQRAINARNDLYADDPQKAAAAQKIIDAGVEGNRTVQDAENALKDAYDNQKTSVVNLKRAIEDKDSTLRDGDKANRDAVQNVKDLSKQADAAQWNVQTLANNLGLTVDQLGQLQGKYAELQQLGQVNIDKIDGADSVIEKMNSVAVALEALRLLAANPDMSIQAAYALAEQNLIDAGVIRNGTVGFQNPKAGTGGGRDNFAAGGPVRGTGTATSDSIVANLSNGEHVWTAAEVIAVGGHTMVQAIRDAALGRKVAASKPSYADRYAAELLKVAGVYGRTASQDTFDPASMYASLGRLASAKPVPVPAGTAKGVASATRGDFSVGDVTINNPVREPSGASLYRTIRRFKRDHEG